MVRKYTAIDSSVEAIQWNGNNFEEVQVFAGKSIFILADGIKVNIGAYIVRGSSFNPIVVSKQVFEDLYRPRSSIVEVNDTTKCKIDRTRACDICGKHNKIVLIFNDKCYCKDCYKDVCYGTDGDTCGR